MNRLNPLYEKRNRLQGELDQLRANYEKDPQDGTLERISNVKRGLDATQRDIVTGLAADPHHTESGTPTDTRRRTTGNETRDAALRAVEARASEIDATSGDRLVSLIEADKLGADSEYLAAVADPDYERAFARQVANPTGAASMLTPDEARAMQRVGAAMEMRALAIGEGGTGGFAVPITLDPTIMLDNDGAVNPIRELASVRTIAASTWKGVKSAGVGFTFGAEAEEVEDGAPTLTQPEITPTRATCWIPFSIESGEDWPGLSGEMATLLADAKSVKEAEVFATGSGAEHIPQGLITGATEIKETAAKELVAVGDIYALQEALKPRWQARAVWLGTNTLGNHVHRLVATADADEAPLMSEDREKILGKPFKEVSTMSAAITTKNSKVLVYGDIGAAYKIVDRVGMAVELVPTVFGENQRPTGQRGLFAHYRVGAKVTAPHAVQVLKVKNE